MTRHLQILGAVAVVLAATGGVSGAARPVDCVDVFTGTGGTGHTHPAASRPFGLVQAGPDTGRNDWKYCSGYQFGDASVMGFSQTHLSGTGAPDLGDVQVLPFSGEPRSLPMRSAVDKSREKASPGRYETYLSDDGIGVRIAASHRAAIYCFHYERGSAGLAVNLPFAIDCDIKGLSPDSPYYRKATTTDCRVEPSGDRLLVGGYRRDGWLKNRRVGFALEFDRPWKSLERIPSGGPGSAPYVILRFGLQPGETLSMKVGISTTGADAALGNLRAEIPSWRFDSVAAEAEAAWNGLLSRTIVEADAAATTNWYTALYHLYLQPTDFSDAGEAPRYTTLSLWDTFRAAQPWYTIAVPEIVAPEVNSMLEIYRRHGRLPVMSFWGSPRDCMIGNHSVPVIVDACLKGVGGFDAEAAYEAIRDTLTKKHADAHNEAWDVLNRYGYYPYDMFEHQTASITLEGSYDDWCASLLAERLGRREDAEFFRRRAGAWRNLWDERTRFFRGRGSDGKWREPFSAFRIRKDANSLWDYTEANAWQYRWHVLHAPQGLVELLGGKRAAADELVRFFSVSKPVDGLGQPDVSGLVGQYAHGNEPSHHVPYMFRYVDRPDLAAEYLRKVFDTQYRPGPDGLCGNDDCGQMSAWYLFTALGFYPLNPCGGDYVIGAPQVPRAEIVLPGGRRFVMTARGLSKACKYVRAVSFRPAGAASPRPLGGFLLKHSDVVNGGELVFDMTDRPPRGDAVVEVSPQGEVKTPAEALRKVRQLRASGAIAPGASATVRFAPGVYELVETLLLGKDDGNVKFVGDPSGRTVFSGGAKLPRFRAGEDGVWRASVPEGTSFDQLWVGGRRATRAKSPNAGYWHVRSLVDDPERHRLAFVGHRDELRRLAALSQKELERVILRFFWSWDTEYGTVKNIDMKKCELSLADPVARNFMMWSQYQPRYTAENFRAALDAPGEWFLDHDAGELLYLPRKGESAETARAVVPRLDRLVVVDGASSVSFESIAFAYGGYRLPRHMFAHQAADALPHAHVEVANSRNVAFDRCRFEHLSTYAVWFRRGCHDSSVRRSRVRDGGAGGFKIGATEDEWRNRRIALDDVPSRIVVDNNIISDYGHVWPEGVGVLLTYGNRCRISHNEICDGFYSGVSQGWDWGYAKEDRQCTFDNAIEWNHIHHIGKAVLSDMGGVYTLGISRGTRVVCNHIHHVYSYGYTGSGAQGLYPDEGSSYILYASNLVHHTKTSAFGMHFGRENTVVNNILACTTKPDSTLVNRVRVENHCSYSAERNIFVWTKGTRAIRGGFARDERGYKLRGNLWWTPDADVSAAFNGGSWEEWCAAGMDEGSVFADPMFVDMKGGNWDLKPGSPALGLGFRQWDWRKCGVYGDRSWVAEAAALKPKMPKPPAVPPLFEKDRSRNDGFEKFAAGRKPGMPYEVNGRGITVEDGVEGAAGKCIKIVDGPDSPGFLPYMQHSLAKMRRSMTVSFSIRVDKQANLLVELREYTPKSKNGQYAEGLSLWFKGGRVSVVGREPDGKGGFMRASASAFMDVADRWVRCRIDVKANPGGRPTFTVTVSGAGGGSETLRSLFAGDDFSAATWIGFIADGARASTCYLDDFSYDID